MTEPIVAQGALIDGSEDPLDEPIVEEQPQPVDAEPEPDLATPEVELEAAPIEVEEEPPVEALPEGLLAITFQDLSLVDYDVDAILDYMIYPDDYEGEDEEFLTLPSDITALDGREISIVGYMIPGEMEQGEVHDFMLVRDLLGCCFGGSPMPDEWLDVQMIEGESAEYRPYLPMRVQGVLTLGGEQDEAGFAMGIFRLQGSEVQVED